jgi:hypothetical protein
VPIFLSPYFLFREKRKEKGVISFFPSAAAAAAAVGSSRILRPA